MPLYEYRCQKCGGVFEVLQKFSDEPLSTHVGCGGEVERLLSPPALQFKGSGWYVTDYGKNGHSSPGAHSGNGGVADSKKPAESKDASPAKSDTSSKKS